ncbi:MAG: HypC/HybG/HupF family hydrogenase formation chaperone [Roseibium sp.]|nr:HypC/HybG/HupF family hydrogenase formation chaperone [Roseibium sp.]
MCLGIPMQVLSSEFGFARCQGEDGEHEIDIRLVGDVAPGTWVLVFLGAAREILDAETARLTADALKALRLVMQGETNVDHLFADLVKPEKPKSTDAA